MKLSKKIISVLLYSCIIFSLLLITIVMQGCMGGADTQFYRNPAFKGYAVRIIAILPIRNVNLNEAESIEVNKYYLAGLSKKLSGLVTITPDITIQLLQRDSVADKYYRFLSANSASGNIDADAVMKIGKLLNCDALMQCEIYDVRKENGIYTRRFGKTTCTLRYTLISTKDGRILWRAKAEAYERTSETDEPAPPLYQAVENGMDEIIYYMGELK